MANLIQKATQEARTVKRPTLQQYIKKMEGEIARALPSVMTPERFSRMMLTAVSSNPKLQETTPQSFLGAMMTAAQLGLEPNTPLGQAYLIPYRKNGVPECQFQLGYKGLIDLAYRSGEVSVIQAQVVCEKDVFEYELGLDPKLRHIPARQDRGDPVAFYGVFRLKDGGYGFEVMSVEGVRAHAKRYSKSYGSGPWQTNFEEMAKKTVLKRVLKYAPMKSDFLRAVAQDETVKTEISEDMYSVAPADLDVDRETGEVIDADFSEVEQETAQEETAQEETAQEDTAQEEPAQEEPAQEEPEQVDTAHAE